MGLQKTRRSRNYYGRPRDPTKLNYDAICHLFIVVRNSLQAEIALKSKIICPSIAYPLLQHYSSIRHLPFFSLQIRVFQKSHSTRTHRAPTLSQAQPNSVLYFFIPNFFCVNSWKFVVNFFAQTRKHPFQKLQKTVTFRTFSRAFWTKTEKNRKNHAFLRGFFASFARLGVTCANFND